MLNHMLKITAIATFMIFSYQAQAILATGGSLYLNAKSIDYLGGLETRDITLMHGIEGIFSIESNYEQGVRVEFEDSNYWSFEFAAPTYDPVTNTNNGKPSKGWIL